jgi:hypothetical protein
MVSSYCGHGEYCSPQDTRRNVAELRSALFLGADLHDVVLHRSHSGNADSPWTDLTFITGGLAGDLVKGARAGLAALLGGEAAQGATATVATVCGRVCAKVAQLIGRDGSTAAKAPRFSQSSVSGAFRHGPFAGQRISDVAAGLRSGAISPRRLPVEVVNRDGALYALNNRSTLALRRGGIDPADWTLRNVTGNPAVERKLSQRLASDGIPNGSDVIRVRGAGPNASAYR